MMRVSTMLPFECRARAGAPFEEAFTPSRTGLPLGFQRVRLLLSAPDNPCPISSRRARWTTRRRTSVERPAHPRELGIVSNARADRPGAPGFGEWGSFRTMPAPRSLLLRYASRCRMVRFFKCGEGFTGPLTSRPQTSRPQVESTNAVGLRTSDDWVCAVVAVGWCTSTAGSRRWARRSRAP